MSTFSWKVGAMRQLSDPDAPRIFDRREFLAWVRKANPQLPERTGLRALSEWEEAQLVQRVTRGIYLNRQAFPLPALEEAVSHLRPGAIVSLSSVLGRAGVLNNPVYWVTAVIPSTATALSEVSAENGSVFKFGHMRQDLLPTAKDDWGQDALEPYTQTATATPEKALVDWLYLASSSRGSARWPLPPLHDWDISDLDPSRLDRLADRMGVEEALQRFRQSLGHEAPRVVLSQRNQRGLR